MGEKLILPHSSHRSAYSLPPLAGGPVWGAHYPHSVKQLRTREHLKRPVGGWLGEGEGKMKHRASKG